MVRLARRALRWLPKRAKTRCEILGRNAQRAEVAVEVEHAASRMIARAGHREVTLGFLGPGATAVLHRTPRAERSAVRSSVRSHADEDVRVVKTAETESAGVGSPARTSREGRTLRAIRNAEGEGNLMRGGVYIGLERGETHSSWMSTGRPRVMC